MTTFCILCRTLIPEDRQRRGAVTCCSDHQKEYRRQRRSERALRFCRLCGRKARKPTRVEPVLHEHDGIKDGCNNASEPLKP
jgi:predicted nucleic acid-binding Zn ribbon protein